VDTPCRMGLSSSRSLSGGGGCGGDGGSAPFWIAGGSYHHGQKGWAGAWFLFGGDIVFVFSNSFQITMFLISVERNPHNRQSKYRYGSSFSVGNWW
jgi:hypothetical protein